MSLDEQIAEEVELYVGYCRKINEHDEFEPTYRAMAHKIFYHIQELRSTGKPSPLGQITGTDSY